MCAARRIPSVGRATTLERSPTCTAWTPSTCSRAVASAPALSRSPSSPLSSSVRRRDGPFPEGVPMRKVHVVLSVLVLAGLVLQFYLAGVGVFSMPEDELFDLHTTNGRIVLPILLLLNIPVAALARNRTLRYALGLVGLLALQTVIFVIAIVLTGSIPFEDVVITPVGTAILSLHVVNGLVILGVAVLQLRRAYAVAFPKQAAAGAYEPEQEPVAAP